MCELCQIAKNVIVAQVRRSWVAEVYAISQVVQVADKYSRVSLKQV